MTRVSDTGNDTSALGSPAIGPLLISPDEIARWGNNGTSWQHRLARFWAFYMPRGKGWFPRLMGRRFGNPEVREVIHTAGGAKLAVDLPSLDIYCSIERLRGVWDRHVLHLCYKLLQPGKTFYDIGANVGLMSIEVANHFKDQVRVFAFEPQPSLAQKVAISARLNGFANVQVFPAMLGSTPGDGELFISSHSIHASVVAREKGATPMHCPKTTIDQLVESGTIPAPDVIKIDVEGAEWDVLHGAANTMAKYQPALIFESDSNATRFGYTRQQLCDYLRKAGGYLLYAVRDDKLELAGDQIPEDIGDMAALAPDREIP